MAYSWDLQDVTEQMIIALVSEQEKNSVNSVTVCLDKPELSPSINIILLSQGIRHNLTWFITKSSFSALAVTANDYTVHSIHSYFV